MRKYSILRDLSRARPAQPFDRGPMGAAGPGPSAETDPRMALRFSDPKIEAGELSKRELRDVAGDPEVQAVAPVIPTTLVWPVEGDVGLRGGQPEKSATATWGVSAVGADLSLRSGAGAVVAVLDTGIDDTHPAFTGTTVVQQDFTGSGNGDVQGHGTHCAGTIFGRDVEGLRIGVAPGVDRALVGKVLGDDGRGDSEMLFRGIQWAAQEAAHVVSMSLGFDFPGLVEELTDGGWPADLATSAALEGYRANLRMFDALMQMIRSRAAFGAGTVVVAAAGNESQRNVDPDYEISASLPAAAEGVVSVGALGQGAGGLEVAYFSNTFPQVSAPGVDVLSAATGGGLRSLNGTSMATPHVAGVAALWWEDVLTSPLPPTAAVVTARLLAHAATDVFADGVDVADRGSGLVRAP